MFASLSQRPPARHGMAAVMIAPVASQTRKASLSVLRGSSIRGTRHIHLISAPHPRWGSHQFGNPRIAVAAQTNTPIHISRNLDIRQTPQQLRQHVTQRALPHAEMFVLSAQFHRPRHTTLNTVLSPLSKRHITTTSLVSAQQPPTTKPNPITKPLATLKSLQPHENIYTIPNILTFTRLLSAPLLGYLLLSPSYPHIYALALFFYAGITDLLDGYLARRLQQFTVVGSVIDPMADKLLMTISTFCLSYTGILPFYTALIIIGRDVGLAISAIWWRWISLPPPKTMSRYWDFSLPSAEVHPTEISKINTLLQLLLIGNAMVLPVLPEALVEAWNLWGVFEGWCALVSGTTLWSGLSYIGNKEAVKIVSQEEVKRVLEEREREGTVEGQQKKKVE